MLKAFQEKVFQTKYKFSTQYGSTGVHYNVHGL